MAGYPDLEPERSRSAGVEGSWHPVEDWRFSLGFFRNDIRDLITTRLTNPDDPGAVSRYSYQNIARAHTQSVEAGVSMALIEGLQAGLSYTLTVARDEEGNRPLEGRARHRGTARLDFRHAGSGFSASARSALVGHRPYYLPGPDGQVVTEVVDRAVTLGLRAALPVWKHIEAFLGVDNLLQAGHEDYLPIAPRTVYGGTNLPY